jgi:hypothetical protein
MLDQKIAVIGCVCGAVGIACAIIIGKGIGLASTLFFSCLTYLIIRRKIAEKTGSFQSFVLDPSKLYAIHITNTFLLILLLAISVYFLHYSRPIEYFLLASLLSGIIGFEILVFQTKHSRFFLASILVQLILLFTSLRWGVIFEFPGLILSDPWYHSVLVQYIISNGHVISPLYRMPWAPVQISEYYGPFPFMHIFVSTTSLVTSLQSYNLSSVCSMGIFGIGSLLFVFLATRKITEDVRLALFSTLFVGVSNWDIVAGFTLIPQSLGYALFALMVFLLVKQTCKPTRSVLLLMAITLLSTILSHTLTSFVLVITIATFFLARLLYPHMATVNKNVRKKGVTLTFTLLSGFSVLFYWIFYTDSFTQRVMSLMSDISTRTGIASPFFKTYFHYEFDQLGIYFLYTLALIGCLLWLTKRERSVLKTSLIAAASVLSLFMYGSWLLGLSSLLPERWFVFLFIMIAAPAAEGLYMTLRVAAGRKMLVLALIIVFLLTFLMITTGDANGDSPLFGKEEVAQTSYLGSEMQGANWVNVSFNGMVLTDQGFADYFWWGLRREIGSINSSISKGSQGWILVERNYIYERPTQLKPFGPYIRLNSTFKNNLQKFNRVYSNGEVAVYAP